MKTLLALCLILSSLTASAMSCGGQFIDEGDSYIHMLDVCGQPDYDTQSNIIYLNKDGYGMNYYIHCGPDGVIDDIQYDRR